MSGIWIAVLLILFGVAGWHWCGHWLRVAVLTSKRDAM